MKARLPEREAERLVALRGYQILDTAPEQAFDDLTLLAAHICGTPMAAISFIDEDRQWFKSRVGLAVSETPRDIAFCAHAILDADVLVVPDALADSRFADNPSVQSNPKIRFYAGAPLLTPEGHALGTLCVMDRVPRRLDSEQKVALEALARQAIGQLELVRTVAALRRAMTVRLEMEEAVLASEAHLRRVIETNPEAMVLLDQAGNITFANAAAELVLGLSRDKITGRGHQDSAFEITRPDGTPFPHEELPFVQVMNTRGPVYDIEMMVAQPAKASRIAISVNASPLTNAEGEMVGVVACFTDISRRKEVERLKDELVSTVSHELRTPLTSLRGFAELMLTREFAPEKQREFLTIIHRETLRLTKLVNEFLDIQRLESGRQLYDFRATDLAPVLREVAELHGRDASFHALRIEVPADLPRVRADADRIRQVVSNLVSNAIKFSPNGPVCMAARLRGAEVVVDVTDQGIGIPAEALPKLFEKFFRVESEATRAIGGTGLGLALVKEIVRAHGGNVSVNSVPGHGSTFSFSIPISAPGVQPIAEALRQGPDVLVIEDDPAFARLLDEYLKADNLTSSSCTTAEQALTMAREAPPRVVLLDISLAGKADGWDLLFALKCDPATRAIPVIVVTGGESNLRGLAIQGAEYVPKPFVSGALLEAVHRQLPSLQNRTILVCDDDSGLRRLVSESLRKEEASVTIVEAANGREALSYLQDRTPDLVLLDLLMPERDGFDVLRALRAERSMMLLPVIVLTAKELSLSDKGYLNRRLAALVNKADASADGLMRVVRHALKVTEPAGVSTPRL